MSRPPALECKDVRKSYRQGNAELKVLDGVNLVVQPAERVAILGRSGSGKSTLLHIMGGLADADAGEVWINGVCISAQSTAARAKFRNGHMGFVYQLHHLLPEFSALENVAMPLLLGRSAPPLAMQQAAEMLAAVGLSERHSHKPSQLSGGERQRVAIARALVTRPAVVLADEPTGNLDRRSAESVFALMVALGQSTGTAFVVVTHDETLAAALDRQLVLSDGRLQNLTENA